MKRLMAILALCLTLGPAPAQAALTLQQIGDAGTDTAWASRVKARVLQDAFSVINESIGTPNHANRILLAGAILREPDKWSGRFTVATAGAAVTTAVTLATVTDAQVQTAVDSLIDGFATYANQ